MTTPPPPPQRVPLFYGVWIPGAGWLAGVKPSGERMVLSFEIRVVAEETAQRIGRGAKVLFVDDSLMAIESTLLEAEAEQKAQRKNGFFSELWKRIRR